MANRSRLIDVEQNSNDLMYKKMGFLYHDKPLIVFIKQNKGRDTGIQQIQYTYVNEMCRHFMTDFNHQIQQCFAMFDIHA